MNEDEQVVIFFDHDHLHRYVPGTPQAQAATGGGLSTPAAAVGDPVPSAAAAATTPGPAVQRRRDENAVSLTTAPDGTIYKLGGGQTGWQTVGSEPGPYFLWRLRPHSTWEAVDYVYSFEVAPDSTLYVLDANRTLRTPVLGTHGVAEPRDQRAVVLRR